MYQHENRVYRCPWCGELSDTGENHDCRQQPDFTITNHGSVWSFQPHTEAAQEWLDEHVEAEDWQFVGPSLCVDHRLAYALAEGIAEAGFTIS